MNTQNSLKQTFTTKQGWIGIGRMLLTTLIICAIMCAIECTAIYALEVTRFEAYTDSISHGQTPPPFTWYVWWRDYLIAIACAWPLAWILSNGIPALWVKFFFKPMGEKHGEPKGWQKAMGFAMVTLSIALVESLLMSIIMYSIDTQVIVPKWEAATGRPVIKPEITGAHWARVWGSALGISYAAALIVTSVVPMLMKKLFAKIDGKKAAKAKMPYNETDLAGKVEYLEEDTNDTDTLLDSKAKPKVKKENVKNKVSK